MIPLLIVVIFRSLPLPSNGLDGKCCHANLSQHGLKDQEELNY